MKVLCLFRFVCIYPAYIDVKKTVQEGRKVPKEYCIENPTYQEIKDVLSAANMNLVIENKIYPRERSKVSWILEYSNSLARTNHNWVTVIAIYCRNFSIVVVFGCSLRTRMELHSTPILRLVEKFWSTSVKWFHNWSQESPIQKVVNQQCNQQVNNKVESRKVARTRSDKKF